MLRKLLVLFVPFFTCIVVPAQDRRPITPEDCVNVHYLEDDIESITSGVQLNPQGTKVAFLVKTPNIPANRNDVALYVKDLLPTAGPEKLLLTDSPVWQMQWLADGEHVTVLARDGGRVSVVKVDVKTGDRVTLVKADKDITEYSSDATGSTIVYAVESVPEHRVIKHTEQEIARGYLIPADETPVDDPMGMPARRLFVVRQSSSDHWDLPEQITLHSPFTGNAIEDIYYYRLMFLHLSPNGKSVLLRYDEPWSGLPEAWKKNQNVHLLNEHGNTSIPLLAQYDIVTRKTLLSLPTPEQLGAPLWSPDSSSFVVSAYSPIGSTLEQDEAKKNLTFSPHLFWASAKGDGKYGRVFEADDASAEPIFWTDQGTLGTNSPRQKTIDQWRFMGGKWNRVGSTQVRAPELLSNANLTGNGSIVIGGYDDKTTPPEIRSYDLITGDSAVLVRLNPQFDHLMLAQSEQVEWEMPGGNKEYGMLLKPPDYVSGKAYPLLIETKPGGMKFECDTGANHYPSFIPQPAASAGILYLTRTYPKDVEFSEITSHYPKGYPGQISEAAYETQVWDSAVDMLAAKGMIDKARVGIIGFSRSGWYTEFALVHGKTRYRAATATDNVEYSFGDYFLWPSKGEIDSAEAMYGGPPQGATLKNWLDYSISFNVDKIHTPVLLEEMGYGEEYENAHKRPIEIDMHHEVLSGLSRLNRPVEMYYYPREDHEPNNPQARLATLQRNLDWYRFWLQDYERPNPEDPQQYVRWRKFREIQDAEDKGVQQSTNSVAVSK